MPTVLIVDDHSTMTSLISELVKQSGCDPIVAFNGEQCLHELSVRPVDLLLLDNHMPVLTGIGVLRRMNAAGLPLVPPVVMFSAANDGRDEAMKLGAVGFVPKDDLFDLLPFIERYANGKVD